MAAFAHSTAADGFVMFTGLAEAALDLQDLVHVPSGQAAAEQAVSSSEEDTSDEAFAARHAVLEAEERQKFNSYAGEHHCL